MGKYSIDDVRMIVNPYRSATGAEQLSFRPFGGTIWLSIYGTGPTASKVYSKGLKLNEIGLLSQYMGELLKSQEPKEISLVYNGWNRQDRKRVMEFILVLKKDDQKVFHVIIKVNNQSYDFPIMYNQTFAFGTGEIPEAERSYRAFYQLIQDFKTLLPLQAQLTNYGTFERGQGGGGNRRGGNYQPRQGGNSGGDGGSYSGQGDFKSSRNLPSDDDIFQQD